MKQRWPGLLFRGFLLLCFFVPGIVFAASTANASPCRDTTDGLRAMQRENISISNDAGEVIELEVLVADDNFERAAGFQHICQDVIAETLILFRYKHEVFARFHMQNVHGPLDIGFFNGSGRLIKALRMETYTENSRPLYGPGKPFQYALEAAPGFFAEKGIQTARSFLKITP